MRLELQNKKKDHGWTKDFFSVKLKYSVILYQGSQIQIIPEYGNVYEEVHTENVSKKQTNREKEREKTREREKEAKRGKERERENERERKREIERERERERERNKREREREILDCGIRGSKTQHSLLQSLLEIILLCWY